MLLLASSLTHAPKKEDALHSITSWASSGLQAMGKKLNKPSEVTAAQGLPLGQSIQMLTILICIHQPVGLGL